MAEDMYSLRESRLTLIIAMQAGGVRNVTPSFNSDLVLPRIYHLSQMC
jgi:hypothetical protein